MNQVDIELLREYTMAMRTYIRLNDPGAIMWAINNMPRYLVPHVKHMVEENKPMIMRYIIDKINKYGLLDNLVISAINGLDTARIEWPDIKLIKKSIKAEEEQRIANNRAQGIESELY